jgi:hypothetical protein
LVTVLRTILPEVERYLPKVTACLRGARIYRWHLELEHQAAPVGSGTIRSRARSAA